MQMNTLSFDRVKAGMQAMREFGVERDAFEVRGIAVKLRTLVGDEHRKVNTYVTAYMEEYQDVDESAFNFDATLDFFLVRKIEVLAYSIEVMGTFNFEGIEYVETGEMNDQGMPVKIPKSVFVRQMLHQVDQTIVDVLYRKYADLVEVAEEKAYEGITFRNPEDELAKAKAKVERLEQELGITHEPELTEDSEQEIEDSDILTEEAIHDMAFQVIPEEDREILLTERADPIPEPPKQAPKQDRMSVGGQEFVKLDEPEELTPEEAAYFDAQEELYQERYGEDVKPPARKPLNTQVPQFQAGSLPSQGAQRRVVRQSMQAPPGIEVAEGIHGPETLTKK